MAWDQLKQIADSNREEWTKLSRQPPSDCPVCGYPLDTNKQGTILHCRLGHWSSNKGIYNT